MVFAGKGVPQWKGGLLEQQNRTEAWMSGVFKGSRAVWSSSWNLEFKLNLGGGMRLELGVHDRQIMVRN